MVCMEELDVALLFPTPAYFIFELITSKGQIWRCGRESLRWEARLDEKERIIHLGSITSVIVPSSYLNHTHLYWAVWFAALTIFSGSPHLPHHKCLHQTSTEDGRGGKKREWKTGTATGFCMCTHMHMHTHTHTCTRVCVHTHTCTRVCVHTHTHTHTFSSRTRWKSCKCWHDENWSNKLFNIWTEREEAGNWSKDKELEKDDIPSLMCM